MELLFLIAVGFAFKSAFDHVRTTRKASESARLKEVAKTFRKGEIPKRKLRGAANRHAAGWWLSEAGHGFPVMRRGWQAGWIAHRTEAEHHRARLEEAKTTHADVQASVLAGLPEHWERQAEAKARRDAILARLQDHPTEAKGRKAVQEADAVVLPFPARPAAPLPSDTVDRKPQPGPYAQPDDDDANSIDPEVEYATSDLPEDYELSDWLRPGEPRCPVCAGRGCRDCRGWGSAAPDPNAPEAEPGTICSACGRPGTEDDPVLAQQGGTNLHRSHAEDDPRNQQAPSPTTGGDTMSADTTYDSAVAQAKALAASADEDLATIRKRQEELSATSDAMQAVDVDPATLSDLMDLLDRYKALEQEAQACGEGAQSIADGLAKRHGGLNEAHQNAPVRAADKDFYAG